MNRIILFIIITLLGINVFAQKLNFTPKLFADKNLVLNVKQFGQFIKRFNYEEDFTGNPINIEFKNKIDRSNYILLLFNSKDPRINDSLYLNKIGEFIQLVVRNSIKINRLSDSTFALTKCQITVKNDPEILFLVMHIEKLFKGYRWALFDAFSNIIPNQKILIDTSLLLPPSIKFIPPTSNEVNFSHLRIVFEDKNNLSFYVSQFTRGNRLNALIDLVKQNDIKFNYVEKLKYYIFDIPGWVIEVSEFIRNDKNSGWLISNIWKCEGKARNYIINEIDSLIKL